MQPSPTRASSSSTSSAPFFLRRCLNSKSLCLLRFLLLTLQRKLNGIHLVPCIILLDPSRAPWRFWLSNRFGSYHSAGNSLTHHLSSQYAPCIQTFCSQRIFHRICQAYLSFITTFVPQLPLVACQILEMSHDGRGHGGPVCTLLPALYNFKAKSRSILFGLLKENVFCCLNNYQSVFVV